MKKSFKLLSAALMALAMTVPVMANTQLTLFDGDESAYAPIDNSYLDEVGTRVQVLYPAESLTAMRGEFINSVKFYTIDPITEGGAQLDIAMGETFKSNYEDVTYVEGLTQMTSYSMVSGVTEVEFVFNSPYLYNGGNLVIETVVTQASMYCFIPFIGDRPLYYSMIGRGQISKFLPKVTFDYGTAEENSAKVVPNEVTFNTIRAERTDVQTVVLTNNGLNSFTPSFSVGAPFSVENPNIVLLAGESIEVPVTFAPMAAGTYTGTLTIDCGAAGVLEVALNGEARVAADDIVIGDETDYASYLPIYGSDIDVVGTQGQMIYPAEMLTSMVGKNILALRFHTKDNIEMNGGVIQLSFKTVDETSFAQATPATELTAVATAVPVYGGTDLEFILDQPYSYTGGNLLVECLVTQAGVTNYRPTYFYGTPYEDFYPGLYTSIWGYSMETELVPFLPKATFSVEKSGDTPEPQVMRGDVNGDENVNIADVTALIDYLLSGNEEGVVLANADCNVDNAINIADVTALIDYLLSGAWNN